MTKLPALKCYWCRSRDAWGILDVSFLVLWAQFADLAAGGPHFGVVDFVELGLEFLAVVWLGVGVEGDFGFGAVLDGFVEIFEYWKGGVTEFVFPVEGSTLGGGGAVSEHPVHAVFADEWVKGLGGFFDGFVEGF